MNNECISPHTKKDYVTFAQNEQLLYIAGGWADNACNYG